MNTINEMNIESLDFEDRKDEQVTNDILLRSNDNKCFTVKRSYAFISEVIKTGIEGDKDATEIPLNVSGNMLSYIVKYMNTKKGDTNIVTLNNGQPILKPTLEQSCGNEKNKWEAKFVNEIYFENKKIIHELVEASNYLSINSLLHLCCACIGYNLTGKNENDIKQELK